MKCVEYALPSGTFVHGYTILEVIGNGGFGITYLATKDGKLVAIKELFYREFQARDLNKSLHVYCMQEYRERAMQKIKLGFLKEAAALQKCHGYDGIVNYIESFEANRTAYIVMEYINGMNLKTYLAERGTLTADQIFEKMKPIMAGLEKMHQLGVVHRDISPDNIILSEDEKSFTLVDFGAARMFNTMATMTAFYKDGYSPIEQYVGDIQQGPWTDIYSMGGTIYYAMTKKHPFSATSRIVYDEMIWPSKLGLEIRPEQEAILKKMMDNTPHLRYQSFQEVLRAMDQMGEKSGEGKSLFSKITNKFKG